MGNLTPGCPAKCNHVLQDQSGVLTQALLGRSVRSDNLTETDEISGQIERLFRRSRSNQLTRLESTEESAHRGLRHSRQNDEITGC